MTTIPYHLWISHEEQIAISYDVPEHLKGITDEKQLRDADLEAFDKELRALGSSVQEKIDEKVIWRMGFPGMILDVNELSIGGVNNLILKVRPIHPHRADLSFKYDSTVKRPVMPLTAGAVLRDNQGVPILGVRGGNVSAGSFATFPGGHVDYTPNRLIENPYIALVQEFEEEVGRPLFSDHREDTLAWAIGLGGTEEVNQLGVLGSQDVPGINVLYTIKVKDSFQDIEKCWRGAKDRGEHAGLARVTHEEMARLAKGEKILFNGKEHGATKYFQENFAHYLTETNK